MGKNSSEKMVSANNNRLYTGEIRQMLIESRRILSSSIQFFDKLMKQLYHKSTDFYQCTVNILTTWTAVLFSVNVPERVS